MGFQFMYIHVPVYVVYSHRQVKECWEDEDDEPEEEDTAKTAVKPDSQVQQLAVTGSPTTREREGGEEGDEEGEGEGEGSSEESSESESEEEELTAYEKAERRIEVRPQQHTLELGHTLMYRVTLMLIQLHWF